MIERIPYRTRQYNSMGTINNIWEPIWENECKRGETYFVYYKLYIGVQSEKNATEMMEGEENIYRLYEYRSETERVYMTKQKCNKVILPVRILTQGKFFIF